MEEKKIEFSPSEDENADFEQIKKNLTEKISNIPITQQSAQSHEEQFVVPSEYIILPSRGKLYPKESALYRMEEIEVRHLTQLDEDILTSRSLIRNGKMVNILLKQCIKNKMINPEELVVGDKNAIMVFLRVSGYGRDYLVDITCPTCGEEAVNYPFNLSELQANMLDIDPVEDGTNRFYHKTSRGNEFEFKYLNSKEEKEISDMLDKVKKNTKSEIDHRISFRSKNQILSINGNEDKRFINKYCDAMLTIERRELYKFINDNEPDIIFKQEFECSICGSKREVNIPITTEFFWPET